MLSTKSSSPVEITEKNTPNSTSQSSKSFSISITSKSKSSVTGEKVTPLNPKKRLYFSLTDDVDPDDEKRHHTELVSGFDQSVGGAIGLNPAKKEKAPLVIKAQNNRDWRQESRRKRGKNLLPAEVQAAAKGHVPSAEDVVNGDLPAFGLTFVKKEEENGDVEMVDTENDKTMTVLPQAETKVKTEDEEAVEALMGERKKSGLIIAGNGDVDGPYMGRSKGSGITEDDAFRTDVASRPDSASLEDYAAIPVSEFGAALLRGMGWKGESDSVTKLNDSSKAKKMERRSALLGIGAKEVPGGVDNFELDTWGKGGKGKKKPDKKYNPVLLKNAKTGEMLTEDELKAKQETQAREEEDWRRRRDRNLAIDEEKKSDRKHQHRDRERKRDRSSEHSRHSSSRRDRSRSPSHRSHRQRGYDDYDDYDRTDKDGRRRETGGDLRSSNSRTKQSKYYDDRESSRSSRDRDREREEYDSKRSRRREEVY